MEAMKKISLPEKMLEHVRKHGDPETIIPFIVEVHLKEMKKIVNDGTCSNHMKKIEAVACSLVFIFLGLFPSDGYALLL